MIASGIAAIDMVRFDRGKTVCKYILLLVIPSNHLITYIIDVITKFAINSFILIDRGILWI